ncbi:MAG: hypothetical protein ACXWWC_06870 [Chitinophagaceae bacterium]
MNGINKLLIGIGIAALAGYIIYAVRRDQSNRKLARIADEGYETANDILFPGTKPFRKRLHYGPVLPE